MIGQKEDLKRAHVEFSKEELFFFSKKKNHLRNAN